MADTFSDFLRVRYLQTGTYENSWNDVYISDIFGLFDSAIAGESLITLGAVTTYSLAALVDGGVSESRSFCLNFGSGAPGPSVPVAVTVPASVPKKFYLIRNNCGQTITFGYATGSSVTISTGLVKLVWCTGTSVIDVPANATEATLVGGVVNIAELRALSVPVVAPGQKAHIFIEGFTVSDDGGDGIFRFESASTATDDGDFVVRPSSNPATGRWLRVQTTPRHRRTADEIAAGVTPANYQLQPGDQRRIDTQVSAHPELVDRAAGRYGGLSWQSFPRLQQSIEEQSPATSGAFTPAINIVGFGNSLGNGAGGAGGEPPAQRFFNTFKRLWDPQNKHGLAFYNHSVGGETMSQLSAQITAAVAAGHTPKAAFVVMATNDAQAPIYNGGQTLPAVYDRLVECIAQLHAIGSDVIVCTCPSENTSDSDYSNALQGIIPQVYPSAVAAPVDEDVQMCPTAANSTLAGDFLGKGGGRAIVVSVRAMHVSQSIRRACRDAGASVLSVDYYDMDARYKYPVSSTDGPSSLYTFPETLHPNALGYAEIFNRCIDDAAYAFAFSVFEQGYELRPVGRLPINRDIAVATLDVTPFLNTDDPMIIRDFSGNSRGKMTAAGLFQFINAAASQSFTIDPTKSSNAIVSRYGAASGYVFADDDTGRQNVGSTQDFLMPANSGGTIRLIASQSGVGRQHTEHRWTTDGTTLTVGGAIFNDGAGVLTAFAGSGLNFRATCFTTGTFIGADITSTSFP